MITIPNMNYTADNISLVQILNSATKVNMLKVCKKFDLYVSPNLKKDETARRIAQELIDNPIEVLSRLNKQELQMVNEFVQGDADAYESSQVLIHKPRFLLEDGRARYKSPISQATSNDVCNERPFWKIEYT